MLVVFSPIFVAGKKIIYSYNFVAALKQRAAPFCGASSTMPSTSKLQGK